MMNTYSFSLAAKIKAKYKPTNLIVYLKSNIQLISGKERKKRKKTIE